MDTTATTTTMNRKRLIRTGCTVLIAVGLGFFLLWTLEPTRHFGNAVPAVTPGSVATESTGEHGSREIGGGELGGTEVSGAEPADAEIGGPEPGGPEPGNGPLPGGNGTSVTFNALILGLDDGGTRTDMIMLANVNPATRKIILLSIPRDTMVSVPGVGMTKINHAHAWGQSQGENHSGTETAIEAVKGLLKCEIRYYVKVDFEGYKHFIDTVGGVDIDLPHEVVVNESDKTFQAGQQHLDGEMALVLVRERFTLPDGEFGRQRLQCLVIVALGQKLLHPEYIPKLPWLASQIVNDVIDTNLSVADALSLAILFQGMSAQDITYMQVPGSEEYAVDPLVKKELFYWVPEPEELRALSELFRCDQPRSHLHPIFRGQR